LSDGELLRRAMQGDEESAAALHDQYFDRIYDFCIRLLLDAEAAASAAEETLRRSLTSLSSLPQPEAFRAHLFSTALDVALKGGSTIERAVEEAQKETFQQIDLERLSDPDHATVAQDEASLVWESVSKLDPRDYALLDLHLRQDLLVPEIAQALGIGKGSVQSGLDRLKKDGEGDALALIMARRASRDCGDLRRVLLALPIAATRGQLRQATEHHTRFCSVCAAARRELVAPLEIFGALAAVPPPAGLRESVRQRVMAAWMAVPHVAPVEAPPETVPPPPPPPPAVTEAAASGEGRGGRWHGLTAGRNLVLPLGAVFIVLGAAGGIAWGTGMFGGSGGGSAKATPSATPGLTPYPTNTAMATVTPTEAPISTPSPTEPPSPTPEETATESQTAIPTSAVTETAGPTSDTPTPQATLLPGATSTPVPTATHSHRY
jgi:DNA-directed RNA polymerase specialized sigma24 family protein